LYSNSLLTICTATRRIITIVVRNNTLLFLLSSAVAKIIKCLIWNKQSIQSVISARVHVTYYTRRQCVVVCTYVVFRRCIVCRRSVRLFVRNSKWKLISKTLFSFELLLRCYGSARRQSTFYAFVVFVLVYRWILSWNLCHVIVL